MAKETSSSSPDLVDRGGYYLLLGLIGFIFVVVDLRTDVFRGVRTSAYDIVSQIFVMSENMRKEAANQYLMIQDRTRLTDKIDQFEKENAVLQASSLKYQSLETENNRLRSLVKLRSLKKDSLLLAEIISIPQNPADQWLVISRGSDDGIFIGQQVIANNGLVGQISEVFNVTSKVLLITDKTHFLPILLGNDNQHMIAEGTGIDNLIVIEDLANDRNLQIGERAITSGLGEIFSYGYPVGTVVNKDFDEITNLQSVYIQPSAGIDKLKYVFVVFPYVVDVADNSSDVSGDLSVRSKPSVQ